MADYLVTWTLEVPNADDPRAAAEFALDFIQGKSEYKMYNADFKVTNQETGGTCTIDALDDGLDDEYCSECGGDTSDGEGFDGYCGNCADRLEAKGHWS